MLNLLRSRYPIAIGGCLLLAASLASGQALQRNQSLSDYPIYKKPLKLPFDEKQYTEESGNLTAQFYLQMQEFAAARNDGSNYSIKHVTPRFMPALPMYSKHRADALLSKFMENAFTGAKATDVRVRVSVRAELGKYDDAQQCFPLSAEFDRSSGASEKGSLFRVYLPSLAAKYPDLAQYTQHSTPVPSLLVMDGKPAFPNKLQLPKAAADWLDARTPGGFEQARLYLYLRLVGADTVSLNKDGKAELVPVWEIEHYAFEDLRNRERLAAE
jgi:hypothetical protein